MSTMTYVRWRSSYYPRMCVLGCSLCLTLCNPMDCSPPGFTVHGILQARMLEQVVISFSRESFWPRDQTQLSCISCIGWWILYHCTPHWIPSFWCTIYDGLPSFMGKGVLRAGSGRESVSNCFWQPECCEKVTASVPRQTAPSACPCGGLC